MAAGPIAGTENPFPFPFASMLVDFSLLTSLLSFHRTGIIAPLASQPPTIAMNHHSMPFSFTTEWVGFDASQRAGLIGAIVWRTGWRIP